MSVPFERELISYLDSLRGKEGLYGIEAATGVGKTRTLIRYFLSDETALMILPNQMAVQQWKLTNPKMTIMNGSRALDRMFFVPFLDTFETIIIDEAHYNTREYFCIKLLLKEYLKHRRGCRIFFVSATMCRSILLSFFPTICFKSFVLQTPFRVDIMYTQNQIVGEFVNRNFLYQNVVKTKHLMETHDKVLCFLASHEDCHEILKRLEKLNLHKQKEVLVYHGGLDTEEKQSIMRRVHNANSFVLLTTNIAESSITIPDLDLVIDSCTECKENQYGFFTVSFATKMALTQRAGRVGRTKDGKVLRLIPERTFDRLSEYNHVRFDLSPTVIKCFLRDMDPVRVFGESVQEEVHDLEELGIHPYTPAEKLKFLTRFQLDVRRTGLMLWNAYHHHYQSPFQYVSISFSLVVVDFYIKKKPLWIYMPTPLTDEASKKIRHFKKAINYEQDHLMTMIHLLLSLGASSQWKDLATKWSLNHRLVKEFWKTWHHFSMEMWEKKGSEAVRFLLDGCNPPINDMICLPKPAIQEIRNFYLRQTTHTDVPFRMEYQYFSSRHLMHSSNYEQKVITLSFENDVWTNYPVDLHDFGKTLENHVSTLFTHREQKRENKRLYDFVVQEIDTEVAYRPNMVKYVEAACHFDLLRYG